MPSSPRPGFSLPATDYALAHQISLIDLSTEDFADIIALSHDVARALWQPDPPTRAGGGLRWLRAHLRGALGTWPTELELPEVGPSDNGLEDRWARVETLIFERLVGIGELFVAMANGPYLLILCAGEFQRRSRDARCSSNGRCPDSLEPRVAGRHAMAGRLCRAHLPGTELTFTLPRPVADWIFDPEHDEQRRAMQFKEQFLSAITIYRYVGGQDRLYRLRFSREQVEASRGPRRQHRL